MNQPFHYTTTDDYSNDDRIAVVVDHQYQPIDQVIVKLLEDFVSNEIFLPLFVTTPEDNVCDCGVNVDSVANANAVSPELLKALISAPESIIEPAPQAIKNAVSFESSVVASILAPCDINNATISSCPSPRLESSFNDNNPATVAADDDDDEDDDDDDDIDNADDDDAEDDDEDCCCLLITSPSFTDVFSIIVALLSSSVV
ncbi:hypothetical protein DERP_012362, partial [Dermatophagoides pteronyssinus]